MKPSAGRVALVTGARRQQPPFRGRHGAGWGSLRDGADDRDVAGPAGPDAEILRSVAAAVQLAAVAAHLDDVRGDAGNPVGAGAAAGW